MPLSPNFPVASNPQEAVGLIDRELPGFAAALAGLLSGPAFDVSKDFADNVRARSTHVPKATPPPLATNGSFAANGIFAAYIRNPGASPGPLEHPIGDKRGDQ
jgi:hypothetical protein